MKLRGGDHVLRGLYREAMERRAGPEIRGGGTQDSDAVW